MHHHRHHRYDDIGSLQLTEEQPSPVVEPFEVPDVKGYLRLTEDDDDVLIASYISAAREQAELMQHRHLVQKQMDLRLDRWPHDPIRLATPVVTVDLVQYAPKTGEPVTVEAATYYVDRFRRPGVLMLARGQEWPHVELQPSSAILIRFTVGYAPESSFWKVGPGPRIRAGMLLLISAWHTNRLPYAVGASAIAEYPYAITSCFTGGVPPKVF